MSIDFPNSPNPGDTYTVGGVTYEWTGVKWAVQSTSGPIVGTTDDLTEGNVNLYYTDARSRAAISVAGDLNYNANTGIISYTDTGGVSSRDYLDFGYFTLLVENAGQYLFYLNDLDFGTITAKGPYSHDGGSI